MRSLLLAAIISCVFGDEGVTPGDSLFSVTLRSALGGARNYKDAQGQFTTRQMEDSFEGPDELVRTAKQWGFSISATGGVGLDKDKTGSQDAHFVGFYGLGPKHGIVPNVGIFAVADGHGSHGEFVSNKALDILNARCEVHFGNYTRRIMYMEEEEKMRSSYFPESEAPANRTHKELSQLALKTTSADIYQVTSRLCANGRHSGTTMSTLIWDFDRNVAAVANVGDSPIWKIDRVNRRFVPLTESHSMAKPELFQDVVNRIAAWFTNSTATISYNENYNSLRISWNNFDQYNTSSPFAGMDLSQLLRMLPQGPESKEGDSAESADSSDDKSTDSSDDKSTDSSDDKSTDSSDDKSTASSDDKSADSSDKSADSSEKPKSFLALAQEPDVKESNKENSVEASKKKSKSTESKEESKEELKKDSKEDLEEEEETEDGMANDDKPGMDWASMLGNLDQDNLPTISGKPIPKNSRRGSADVQIRFYKNMDASEQLQRFLMDARLGHVNLAKSIADSQATSPNPFSMFIGGGGNDDVVSEAFIKEDPFVKVYDLDNSTETFNEVLLTSDGIETVVRKAVSTEVYKERVLECNGSDGKKCLPDPIKLLKEYSQQKEVFYKPFWDVMSEFESIVDERTEFKLFEIFNSISPGDDIALEFRRKIEELDDEVKPPQADDITVIYFKRSSSVLTGIRRHIAD